MNSIITKYNFYDYHDVINNKKYIIIRMHTKYHTCGQAGPLSKAAASAVATAGCPATPGSSSSARSVVALMVSCGMRPCCPNAGAMAANSLQQYRFMSTSHHYEFAKQPVVCSALSLSLSSSLPCTLASLHVNHRRKHKEHSCMQ